ncbi:MAG: HD domain-containing protein [Nitrospinae bacterium]|nr:HD domain-containing protein [Nitrospinota bacterium]MBL7019858.1 HD domain-containing protein [Nitrospinaceae bacterium]
MPLINKTCQFVEQQLAGDGSGHDWWHIHRVWNLAKNIAEQEGANLLIVELSALLHDIADWKFHDGDESKGPQMAEHFLIENQVDRDVIDPVIEIIATLSYKGAGVATPMKTLEGKVVQDADRLDAIGAMGIARTFAYGGHKNRLMYHPDEKPVLHQSFADYKKNTGHTINHFYEKLLLLKDRMNTASAKQMAEGRHQFMQTYLDQFYEEWDGKA